MQNKLTLTLAQIDTYSRTARSIDFLIFISFQPTSQKRNEEKYSIMKQQAEIEFELYELIRCVNFQLQSRERTRLIVSRLDRFSSSKTSAFWFVLC